VSLQLFLNNILILELLVVMTASLSWIIDIHCIYILYCISISSGKW